MLVAYVIQCPTAQLIKDKQSKRTKPGGVQYLQSNKKGIKGIKGKYFWSHKYWRDATYGDEGAKLKTNQRELFLESRLWAFFSIHIHIPDPTPRRSMFMNLEGPLL